MDAVRRVSRLATQRPSLWTCYGLVVGAAYAVVLAAYVPNEPVANVLWGLVFVAFFGSMGWLFANDADLSTMQGIVGLPSIPVCLAVAAIFVLVFTLIAAALFPVVMVVRPFYTGQGQVQ
jgi:hypothetical protein